MTTTGCQSSVENGAGSSQLPKESFAKLVGNKLAPHGYDTGVNAFQWLVSLGRHSELVKSSGGTYLQNLHAQDDFPKGFAGLEIRSKVGATTVDCETQRIQG